MGDGGEMQSEPPSGYCPDCDAVQPITETMPWQADLCAVCGADVEDR